VYQNGDANLSGASHTQIHIPPAHAIGDFAMPSARRPDSPPPFASYDSAHGQHGVGYPFTRGITEGDPNEEGGSSVEEDQELEVKVVENPRFQPKTNKADSGAPSAQGSRVRKFSLLGPHRDKDKDGSSVSDAKDKVPGGSTFFGSLRGMFAPHHKKERDGSVSSFDLPPRPSSPVNKKGSKRGKWTTRTERNLKALKKEGSGSDDDRDQDRGRAGVYAPPGVSSMFDSPPASPVQGSRRLKKSRAQGQGRSASVPPPSPSPSATQKPPSLSSSPTPTPQASASRTQVAPTTSTVTVLQQHDVSRGSSVRSAPSGRGKGRGRGGHRRAASVSDAVGTGAPRRQGTLHVVSPYPPASLMGVVQDTRSQSHPNLGDGGLGEVVKAPPRVGKKEILSSYGGGGAGMGASSSPGVVSAGLRAPRSVFDTDTDADANAGEGMTSSVSAPALLAPLPVAGAMRRPAKSPLRSALRNSSRSPSPLPTAVRADTGVDVKIEEEVGEGEEGDGGSVSSYETGRETFFDGDERPRSPFKGVLNGFRLGCCRGVMFLLLLNGAVGYRGGRV
jgi:hypothetical protein